MTTRRQAEPPRQRTSWERSAVLAGTGVLAVLLSASLVRLVLG
ncbi:MAG TPA: hypothetical protein VFL94_03330 [Actinomycetales bacterium]|nr:hypothetical protein [Actinomycetales bacterium]